MQTQSASHPSRAMFVQRGRVASARGQHINVRNPSEIARWSRELGVTWMQLFAIIDRVGTSIRAIRNAVLNGCSATH
jgi:Protein of unknown function (DUF3606)